jgi:hypothetical protein
MASHFKKYLESRAVFSLGYLCFNLNKIKDVENTVEDLTPVSSQTSPSTQMSVVSDKLDESDEKRRASGSQEKAPQKGSKKPRVNKKEAILNNDEIEQEFSFSNIPDLPLPASLQPSQKLDMENDPDSKADQTKPKNDSRRAQNDSELSEKAEDPECAGETKIEPTKAGAAKVKRTYSNRATKKKAQSELYVTCLESLAECESNNNKPLDPVQEAVASRENFQVEKNQAQDLKEVTEQTKPGQAKVKRVASKTMKKAAIRVESDLIGSLDVPQVKEEAQKEKVQVEAQSKLNVENAPSSKETTGESLETTEPTKQSRPTKNDSRKAQNDSELSEKAEDPDCAEEARTELTKAGAAKVKRTSSNRATKKKAQSELYVTCLESLPEKSLDNEIEASDELPGKNKRLIYP